jgi:hypothetical protein
MILNISVFCYNLGHFWCQWPKDEVKAQNTVNVTRVSQLTASCRVLLLFCNTQRMSDT